MRPLRIGLGLALTVLGMLLSWGDWTKLFRSDLPAPLILLALAILGMSLFVAVGGACLVFQGVWRRISERTFRTTGAAASVLLGMALLAAGVLLLVLGGMLAQKPEARLWGAGYLILGAIGGTLGVVAFARPRFTSGWSPALPAAPVEIPIPFQPPEPNLDALRELKRRLKEQGRT